MGYLVLATNGLHTIPARVHNTRQKTHIFPDIWQKNTYLSRYLAKNTYLSRYPAKQQFFLSFFLSRPTLQNQLECKKSESATPILATNSRSMHNSSKRICAQLETRIGKPQSVFQFGNGLEGENSNDLSNQFFSNIWAKRFLSRILHFWLVLFANSGEPTNSFGGNSNPKDEVGQLRNLFASWKRFGYIYFFLSQNEIFYPRRREKQKYFPFHFRCAKRNWYIYFSCFYYSPKNQLSLPSEIRWQVFLDSKRTANPHLHDRWRRILFVGRDPKKVEFVRNSTFEQNSKGYFSAKDRLDFSRDFFFEAPRSGFSREIHIVFAVESWIAKTDIWRDISTEILEKVLQMHILSTFLDSKEVERIGKSFFLFCEKDFSLFSLSKKNNFRYQNVERENQRSAKDFFGKDGIAICQSCSFAHFAGEHPRKQLGSGYFQRSLFARKSWPNASCSNSWFSTILRRYVCLWSTWRKGCCLGWQPSAMHIWHKWVRLAVCFSNFQSLPGGLAASRIQIHPCVACAYSAFGIGWKNLRNYCWNRKRFQWETRAPVAKVVWQSGRFLSLQAGCFGSAFAPTSWRVAAIPTTFGSQLHGFVPTRLHPRLFGNFGSPKVGRASRRKPQLFPAGRYSFRKFAGLHLGQHQFCWKPRMHFLPNYWWTRNHHQILQQVCFSNRSWRCAEPVWWPHVGCCCQHKRTFTPNFGPSRRSFPGMYTGGDIYLWLHSKRIFSQEFRSFVGGNCGHGNSRGSRVVSSCSTPSPMEKLCKLSRPLLCFGRSLPRFHLRCMERQ